MTRWVVGVATLVVAAAASYAAALVTLIDTCAGSDTAETGPARASDQGELCHAVGDSDYGLYVAGSVIAVSVIVSVLLAVLWWRSPRLRLVGLTACLWVPLLLVAALRAPDDACSEEEQNELPAYACSRTNL